MTEPDPGYTPMVDAARLSASASGMTGLMPPRRPRQARARPSPTWGWPWKCRRRSSRSPRWPTCSARPSWPRSARRSRPRHGHRLRGQRDPGRQDGGRSRGGGYQPVAISAARRNAERNGAADRIQIRHSDVFSAVDGTFDLIIFDPPFRWFPPRDLLEAATTDDGYRTLTAFFRGARRHLTSRGRMLISFGTSGDLAYLQQLADAEDLRTEVRTRQELTRDGWQVEYFTFRMTAPDRQSHPSAGQS